MNAVIYCRVSTEEQAREGYSLNSQDHVCRSYCAREGFTVDKVYVEGGVSAKTANRPELKKLLDYCLVPKNNVNVLVVYKLDRLARNLVDHTEIITLLSRRGIALRSTTEHIDHSPVGKLTTNMIASLAQFDNDMKGERTREGMKQALREGRWPFHAPIGYKFKTDLNFKKILIPSEHASLIKDLFTLFSKGTYRQVDLIPILKKRWPRKSLTKQTLSYILKNPIYMGEIRHKYLDGPTKGVHEPLIAQDMFLRTQALLNGHRPLAVPHQRNNPDFPLRNFAKCPVCSNKLTGSWSTSRSKQRYAYYHCYQKGCPQKPITKIEIESAFQTFLKGLEPSAGILKLFETILLNVWNQKHIDQENSKKGIEKELQGLVDKKEKLVELIVNGTLDDQTYKESSEKVQTEIISKQIELNDLKIDKNDTESCINYCKAFLANLSLLWTHADLNMKQRFQNLLLPKGITYKEGVIGTTEYSAIIKLFQKNKDDQSKLAPLILGNWNHLSNELFNIQSLMQEVENPSFSRKEAGLVGCFN